LLRTDSILKISSGRTPEADALSSQPTMSRLENKLTDRELYRIGEVFLEEFIHSYAKAPEVIILDCDDSNFNTYGEQQGALFNNYYGERSFKEDKHPVRFFRTFMYQAGSWKHSQRVIVKIEVNEMGKNGRNQFEC